MNIQSNSCQTDEIALACRVRPSFPAGTNSRQGKHHEPNRGKVSTIHIPEARSVPFVCNGRAECIPVTLTPASAQEDIAGGQASVKSPDGTLEMSIHGDGPLTYSVFADGKKVLTESKSGLKFRDGVSFGLKLTSHRKTGSGKGRRT
jgi:hypothetical protein